MSVSAAAGRWPLHALGKAIAVGAEMVARGAPTADVLAAMGVLVGLFRLDGDRERTGAVLSAVQGSGRRANDMPVVHNAYRHD